MRQVFKKIPKELYEYAKIDGCNHFNMFYYIVLPFAKPFVFLLAIFIWINTSNQYFYPYLLIENLNNKNLALCIHSALLQNNRRFGY